VDEARRRELAGFLRSRRDRLAPESVGLPAIGRRRAPGLRREEVAQLAGVGVTWYTWLEQGRPINVSGQVLGAISRALRLDEDEISHLFTLAGMPEETAIPDGDLVAASISTILETLDPLPAHVVSARYDVLAWNRGDSLLFGDFGKLPPERRNILWLLFTEPSWEKMIGGFETETGLGCVARFRRTYATHIGDPDWQRLLEELLDRSPLFRKAWEKHDVTSYLPRLKNLNHPLVGPMRLACTTLWLADQPGTRMVIYTPPDEQAKATLRRLQDHGTWVPWTPASQ
jgi:transcriptional regulator with XRE-family HTH domain